MIKYLWLVFALIFLAFSIYHSRLSRKKIPVFEKKGPIIGSVMGVSTGTSDFIEHFNKYVGERNAESKVINIWTAMAYLVSAVIAIFSFLISTPDPIW